MQLDCTYVYIALTTRRMYLIRPSLVSIRITVTPDHPQFYHPPSRKDSNFLLPSRSFLSTSAGTALSHPVAVPSALLLVYRLRALFSTVHGLNLCLIADYWDFARMRKERRPWLARSLDRLSSRRESTRSWKTADEDESLILSVVSRSRSLVVSSRYLSDR